MAAVLEPKDAAAKHDSQVDEQIAQATSRIRVHDAAFGGLTLAALVLGYATLAIVLDQYLVLPAWVRQVGFVGFVGTLAAATYFTILRPLGKRINPLYAAKQVEGTLDDPKNSVTGYVDARENGDLNATVKAALASRAAKVAAEADVNRAVNHRSLVWLGGIAVALLLALIVLFFVFRPAQFASLANRAFMPFSGGTIASRTELTLTKPEPADPTITTGQSVTVAVTVKGRIPKADSAEKVRLLVRHNPNDPNYDEVPMTQGASSRDWEVRVPDHLIQNGFWYKVAGGDAETPEYKVTVQSLPRFGTFAVSYEYPKYLKRPPFSDTNPVITGPRGTSVVMLAKANRAVRDGLMTIEPSNVRVNGVPDPSDPNTLRFAFKLTESAKYKLTFNATNGERTADPFAGVITVEEDRAPVITINKPEEDEIEEPSNGQLKIDAKIGDDWGIDTVTLKMRTLGASARQLPDVPFLNGKSKSFRREKDDTYPTDLDYKGSVDFDKVTKDFTGLDFTLTPETVIEYWLEAADNCTEPKPNVGVSAKKRVRLGAPRVEKEEKKKLDEQKGDRKDEEQKHNDQQQQRLDTENRDRKNPNDQKDKGGQPEPKKGENGAQDQKKDATPEKQPGDAAGPKKENPDDKKGDGMGMGGMSDPTPKDGKEPQPKPGDKSSGAKDKGTEGTKGDNKSDGKSDVERNAREFQDELNRENKDGASPKPNNTAQEQERPEPAKSKPQPKTDMNGANGASEPKPEPKTEPNTPMADKKDAAPAENRAAPKDATPGTDKPGEPQKGATPPRDPNGKMGEPKPADNKPNDTNPGEVKPDRAPPAGGTKPQPKDGAPKDKDADAKPSAGANDPMKPNETPAADAKPAPTDGKPDDKGDKKAANGGAKQPPPGADKPEPQPQNAGDAKGGPETAPMPKQKLDPEKVKELQDAAKDLNSDDKNKQQAARDKLDKAVGEQNRKELEQLGKDLQSKDAATRKAAEEKVKDAIEKAKKDADQKAGGEPKGPKEPTGPKTDNPPSAGEPKEPKKDDMNPGGAGKEPKEPTEQKNKDIADAVKDLQSGDPKKQQEARDKLDKMVGKQNREAAEKEAEQLEKDLKSDNPQTKAAAEKKLEDIRKKVEEQSAKKDGKGGTNEPKGKEPSPEELADLAKKAQDLQSNDPDTRKKAQKELDDKLGPEQRQKLEDMLKSQKPGDPKEDAEKLKRQLEEMAKQQGKKPKEDFEPMGGGSRPANERMDDPTERARNAQLNLEDFKKDENRKKLQEKKGWSDAEYEKFLKDYEDYANRLREEAKKDAERPTAPAPKAAGSPMFTPGSAGKVEGPGGANSNATGSGAPAAPPGFDKAREKFQEALKKKP